MQVIIIPDDKAVYVDGKAINIANFEDLGIAPNVHAVTWDSGLKRGEIQYKVPAPTVLDEAGFEAMFIQAVAHHMNVYMDLERAAVAFRMKDEAHTARLKALEEQRAVKEASTQDRLTKSEAELQALRAQIVKLSAAQKS